MLSQDILIQRITGNYTRSPTPPELIVPQVY